MSLNVGKLHAIIHLSQHEQHRNDILKTGFMVSMYVVCVCVCILYICFTYCFFCVCMFVIPFLPSVKVKHQSFNRQTYQLSEAVSCSQSTARLATHFAEFYRILFIQQVVRPTIRLSESYHVSITCISVVQNVSRPVPITSIAALRSASQFVYTMKATYPPFLFKRVHKISKSEY